MVSKILGAGNDPKRELLFLMMSEHTAKLSEVRKVRAAQSSQLQRMGAAAQASAAESAIGVGVGHWM